MTRDETKGMLTLLKTAYPGFYAKKSRDELSMILDLWYEMFTEENVVVVKAALKELIADHAGYPPDIAVIKAKIRSMSEAVNKEPTDEELWLLLKKAAMHGATDTYNEYESLPPVVRRYLGGPGTLREYALMDSEKFNTVIHGQFLRSISVLRERERYEKTLSPEVKAALGGKKMPLIPQKNEEGWTQLCLISQ